MATPRDLLGYRQPSLLGYQQRPTWSQEEIDAATIQRAQADRGGNALVQGWQSTGAGINAGDLGELALAAEQAGDKERAAGLLRRMRVAQAQSQVYAPDTRSVGDVWKDPTRVANWAGGVLGSMARSAAPAVVAGVAGAGAGALLAGVPGAVAGGLRGIVTYAPAMAVSYDQLRGENVAQQYDDPEVMKRSADERALAATTTAALQTIPEAIVPMRAVGAMIGRGATPAARAAAKAVQNRPMDVLKDAVTEAGTETLQMELSHQGLQALGSTAERQPMEYLDAALAGAVGGGGVSGASNALGAAGDKLATLSQPVAGEPTDKEVLGAAGSKVVEKVKDALSKPFTQTVAEMMTPDKAVADSLNGNQDPEAIAAAISELDQTVVPTAENMVDELLKQDRVSASDKARLAQLKGTMADPVARNEVGVIAIKTKATEVLGAAFTTVSDYVKRVAGKIQSKFSMEGMDIAPLVDAMAPIFGETAPERAQKLVELASKYEGITSAEAITDSKLADSLEQIADMLDAMGKNGEGIKKALSGVGMTSLPKLIDELNTVPGAQADLGKQDSFLRTMLQKGQRGVSGKRVARAIDDLAPKFAGMSPEAQTENLSALSVAFGSPETARAVIEYYAPIRTKALEAFQKQTDALTPLDQRTRGITRPPQAEMEAAEGQLTEGDYTNKKASYRDSNPARPFFAMSDRKELKAEVAKGGVVAGMDEYVRRTGRSAAEAFGRVKADLEQRLKASRNRDKGWLTQELERAVATGADLRTRQELEKRLAKAEVRTDLPKLERQYAKMLRDTPAPEDMDPKRFDRALSRYRVVLRDETDTQASDEDIHRFQRLLRVRKAIKPPQPPEDATDTEAKADYEERLADYQAKVGAIDETTITFTKTDGKKLKTSAESMTYASQVKGGDLQKFLSAVSSVLDRDDIAGVELPSTLTVFRQGEKRQRRTLAEMRGIAKVRKQLQARAESSDPKQKAFAEQALALIDETSGQNTQRAGRKAKKLGPTRAKRAEEKAAKKLARTLANNKRDEAKRAVYTSRRVDRQEAIGAQALPLLTEVIPQLADAEVDLKEARAAGERGPEIDALREKVADLRSEERVLSELVREWLDKAFPMPKSQEYTSRLADDVLMEGEYDENDLRAAYLEEAISVLEERLAAVREPLSREEVTKLYALNTALKEASAKEAPAIYTKIDEITARFNAKSPLVDGILTDLNAKKTELNELMDSTGRNPRDGSRRVKDNPSREPNAAVRAEQDELAQSLMSAELDPKTIPMMELSFQGKIDELRKKGGVDAAEMLRAYQFAMGRLRRIKGKRKDDDAISYTVGPDGKPQALPLDPDTSYGKGEQSGSFDGPKIESLEKTPRVQEAPELTPEVRTARLEQRKRLRALQEAVQKERLDKMMRKEGDPSAPVVKEAAEKNADSLAAREAMKDATPGKSWVSPRVKSQPVGEIQAEQARQRAREDQVVKVVDTLVETLREMLPRKSDGRLVEAKPGLAEQRTAERAADTQALIARLERLLGPAVMPATSAREIDPMSSAPRTIVDEKSGWRSEPTSLVRRVVASTKAPEIPESDSAAINKEIAQSRARLKLAKSKRPNEETWPAGFGEKMRKRKAAALERAATQKEKASEKEQGQVEGRREEGRREEVLKQNAQSVGTGPARRTTLKKLKEELLRMRGKDIEVTVGKLLSGFGRYDRKVHGPLVERLITISHAAPNKMSVLYHEALHDFFAELGKDPATLRIKQQLLDAASTGHVQKQLRELLKNEPAALAQLSDPEERLAYMFQFRMADPEKMRIGPNTDTLFQRIAAAIRRFTKLLTTNEKAEQILLALYDGRLADPSTAAKVMAEWNTVGDHFERFAGPVKHAAEKMFSANTSQLRAMNIPAFNTIADLFENNVKKTGLLIARAQSGGIWRTKLERLLAGHSEKEIKEAMVHMQSMKDPVTDLHKKLAEFFEEIRKWQIRKGVMQFTGKFNPATGEPMYEPMGKVKRYFPRVVDLDMITKNGPQFSRLLQKHMGYSQKQADDVLHQLRVGDQMLVKPHGVDREAGFSPYAQSVISRELILDEAGATALAEAGFWSQDFAGVMTRYIDQAVHRAEYTERFGNIGEKLDALMEQAGKEGATKDQIERAKRLISGLDGTIHRDMNPTIKQIQMALLTLQNAVLLPLAVFSQMIDPLGIAVRSGDVRDAGAAYKRVLTDIAQWASPKPDRAREMAEIIGTVQNDSVLQAMGMVHNGMYMSTGLRKINNFIFKYNGMQGINNSFRTAAVIAAEKYILEHRNDARRMEELDLTPADIKEVKPGEIDYTSEKIQQALFRFADGAVVRPNAAHRPLWMSNPRLMLVAHLKQFAFSFQEVILKRVAHEKSYGNSGPLKVLAMYAPIMFAADMAKWMLFGGMPQGWSYLEMFAHAVHRSGLLGVGTFGADAVQNVALERNPVLGALGPTAEHLGLLASWIGGGVPLEDVVDRSVPLARLLTK